VPAYLLSRPVNLTVRRQEYDKPVIVEIKVDTRPKMQHMERIPTGLQYEDFTLIVRSTTVTLCGSPSDLWQLEKLFGSTYFEVFLAVTETYCQFELPTILERNVHCPRLSLDLPIDGEVSRSVRETLREHLSALTGVTQ
jgi:hypothetical protein